MKKLPFVLVWSRLFLGGLMVFFAFYLGVASQIALGVCLSIGLLSDIFDGIIARKAGVSSEKLRRLDSQIDVVFWLCAMGCAWILHPEIIGRHKHEIYTISIMEALTYVFSFARFRKETCTHAILSKFWGLLLFASFFSILVFGKSGWVFYLMFVWGIIAHLDVYLIIFLLPKWTHDVPSSWHAWQLRKGRDIKRNKLFNG